MERKGREKAVEWRRVERIGILVLLVVSMCGRWECEGGFGVYVYSSYTYRHDVAIGRTRSYLILRPKSYSYLSLSGGQRFEV